MPIDYNLAAHFLTKRESLLKLILIVGYRPRLQPDAAISYVAAIYDLGPFKKTGDYLSGAFEILPFSADQNHPAQPLFGQDFFDLHCPNPASIFSHFLVAEYFAKIMPHHILFIMRKLHGSCLVSRP